MRRTQRPFWAELLFFGPLRYFVAGGSILLVIWLCMTVPKWLGSLKDEVEYSEDLRDHSPAYADIASLRTVEETFALSDEIPNLYCKCKLVSGETIWVRFTKTQYIQMIDPNYVKPNKNQEIAFTEPLRLHGTVDTVGRAIDAFLDNNNFILIVDSAEHIPG